MDLIILSEQVQIPYVHTVQARFFGNLFAAKAWVREVAGRSVK